MTSLPRKKSTEMCAIGGEVRETAVYGYYDGMENDENLANEH